MLTLLKIRNLALVDELVWELGAGLVAVTGETGAGKSVIVGALKLVLGERADKSLIRTGEESCTVEAVFDLGDATEVDAVLEDGGLDACADGSLIVRRVIGIKGNRQFINDSPVTLNLLKRLGDRLVDLHGPHDHQSLLSTERQLVMLDAYADVDLSAYREAWAAWREKQAELEDLQEASTASEQELELLRHQLREIDEADLRPDEEAEVTERWRRSGNATRLVELSSAAAGVLGDEESGIVTQLAEVQRLARELEKLDPSVAERTLGLEGAVVELEELERSLRDYAEALDLDPAEAAELEERVNLFESLKRKYGPSLEAVLAHRDRCAERLDSVDHRDERLESLRGEVEELNARVEKLGRAAGLKRKKAAPRLAKEIAAQLRDLGFKASTFEICLEARRQAGSAGFEQVEFLFGPNPGEPVQPLRQVASSGEVSRVMLAVKSALADQDATPLMVFDEIDANVGGEIARAVGRKMSALGERHQVVAITHFPQVAATAARHYVVEKQVVGGRTCSRLFPVDGEGRIDELVRMLGGGGESAREMARSLMTDS
jgi:DNA repair protein RecN (Recombination protein N)